VALYWDRDSWWAHLKEGDFSYDKEVLATARLYSLQWEFLFQKHLPGLPLASEDNSYKVVLLPQDRHVSTEVVEALLAHARSGGTLVISGDALEVPALREALGVSGGQKRGTGQVDWADGSFGVEAWRQVELPAGAESEVFATLEAEGQRHPAVIIKKWGQGNLVYFAFGLGAALVNAPLPANSLVKAAVARCQPPPVEAEAGLEPVLFRGDHFHLLGIANNQPQSVQADVRVPRIKGRQRVFDVLDCSEVKCDSGGELKFTAALEAHQVKFYQIVPAGSVQVAPLAPQEVSPGPALKPATRKPQPWQLPAYVPELDAARKEGRIAVGISGAKDLVEALQEGLRQRPELAAVKVSGADLRAELLAHLDALVLCNSGPESPAAITWFSDVREFVEAGGGVLLTHFAIGGGYYPPRLFPEMGRDRGKVVSSTAIPVGDHPIVGGYSGDERYTHMYWDHVIIEPGPAAQPLFQDEAGNVIAVAGPVGKGRVVATGFCFEIDGTPSVSQPAAPTGWPLELLLRILQWAGGR
jgi:uncharacterized membrane protein